MKLEKAKKYVANNFDMKKFKGGLMWILKLIGGGISLAASQYFANECGVNLTVGSEPKKLSFSSNTFDPDNYIYCKSLDDRVIWSLYKSSKDTYSDSKRRSIAESIAEKAIESCDSNTKMMSVSLLEKVSSECYGNTTKDRIMELIKDIGDSV